MSERRTLHFRLDPALRAFFEYLDANGRQFVAEEYDLFAAGYRARIAEEPAPPAPVEVLS